MGKNIKNTKLMMEHFKIIKYAWLEFKKTPCLWAVFVALLISMYMGYLWVDSVKSNAVEVKTINEKYQNVIDKKDSASMELIKVYERTLAVEHFQKQIDSLTHNSKK